MYEQFIANRQYRQLLEIIKDKKDEEANYYRLICLFELHEYIEIIKYIPDYISQSKKYYYEMILIQIKTLLALDKDSEAYEILKEELKMPYIPSKYEHEFQHMFDQLAKKSKQLAKNDSPYIYMKDFELNELLLSHEDNEVIMMVLNELSNRNIRPFLPSLKAFLLNPEKKNYLKVFIFEILASQAVNEEITSIVKGVKCEVNPCDLTPLLKQVIIKDIMNAIEKKEDKNKSVLNICEGILIAYLASIYPLEVEEDEVMLLAAAIYAVALKDLGIIIDLASIARLFEVKTEFLEQYYQETVNLSAYF